MLIALLMLFFSEVHNNTVRETNQAFSCFISRSHLFRTAACFELRNGGDTPFEASTTFIGQKILLPWTALLGQHCLDSVLLIFLSVRFVLALAVKLLNEMLSWTLH